MINYDVSRITIYFFHELIVILDFIANILTEDDKLAIIGELREFQL